MHVEADGEHWMHVKSETETNCVCEQIIEEVIHEEPMEEEVTKTRHVIEEAPLPTQHQYLPQQTYQHAIGRSFGVAFNDRSFMGPESTTSVTDRYYYGSRGRSTF